MALQSADISADRQRGSDAAGGGDLLADGWGEDHRADGVFNFCGIVYQEGD